jgi:tetratricopeptide (TPR) repeat protein
MRSSDSSLEGRSRVNVRAAMARTHLQLKETQKAVAILEPALSDAKSKSGDSARPEASREEAELLAVMIESRLQQMVQSRIAPGSAQTPAGLLPLAERLAELAGSDAPALALAGSAAYAAGSFDKARRFYSEARTQDDKLPRARIGLSRTLEQLALAEVARAEEKDATRTLDKTAKKDAPPPPSSDARNAALANAMTLLREAQKLEDSASVQRNLAAVYLLQGNAGESERLRGDVLALRLRSRAQLALGKTAAALESAERAVSEGRKQIENLPSAEGNRRPLLTQRVAEAEIELAARFLTDGKDTRERLERAVELLDQASKDLGTLPDAKDLQRAAQRDLAIAHLRRGRLRLAEAEGQINKNGVTATTLKQAEDALADLQQAIESNRLENVAGGREVGQALCLAALAAAQANQPKAARDYVTKAGQNGCELVSPYNRLGTELLSVFVLYRGTNAPAQREQLLRSLPRLQGRAGNAPDAATLQRVLRALLYSTNMALAYDYYVSGRGKQVGPALRAAQKSAPRSDDEDAILQHNLAVVDLNEGRNVGEKTLERLGQNPPEALVNLGILQDRRGQPRKALDLYRRAFERGARTPKLREWIDTKDRLLGGSAQ